MPLTMAKAGERNSIKKVGGKAETKQQQGGSAGRSGRDNSPRI